jgi:ketosteroid isomerase-like protein
MQREMESSVRWALRAFVGMATALGVFAGCSHPSDEARLRETIETMRGAAQARDVSGVLEGIAADFVGRKGEVDRAGLARILKLEFLRAESIGVSLGALSVEVDGDRATVRFGMTLRDRSQRLLPGGRETYSVVSGWRRDGRRWLCVNATWDRKD